MSFSPASPPGVFCPLPHPVRQDQCPKASGWRREDQFYPLPMESDYPLNSKRGNAIPFPFPLPEPGSVMIWRAIAQLPLPPTILAKVWNRRYSAKPYHMPQTLSVLLSTTDRNCRPIWHQFQPQEGGKEYMYTNLAGSFRVLWQQNLRPVAHNKWPHTTPYIGSLQCSVLYTYHIIVSIHQPTPPPQVKHSWSSEFLPNESSKATKSGVWAPRSADLVRNHNRGLAIAFPTKRKKYSFSYQSSNSSDIS